MENRHAKVRTETVDDNEDIWAKEKRAKRFKKRQFETDLTPGMRSEIRGFALTPDEAHQLKLKAEALNTSISCLVREALRKINVI